MYPGRSGQLWCVPDPRGADARATSWWRCFASEAALIIRRANAELQALREEGRGISERLVEHYRELLGYLDPRSTPSDPTSSSRSTRDTSPCAIRARTRPNIPALTSALTRAVISFKVENPGSRDRTRAGETGGRACRRVRRGACGHRVDRRLSRQPLPATGRQADGTRPRDDVLVRAHGRA
jgi:hypothetical protein